MSLLNRNKPPQMGKTQASPVEQRKLHLEYDISRVGNTPRDLVAMMLALQTQVYGQTILDKLPHAALVGHVKLLCIRYKGDRIKRAIIKAAETSPAPFSFKYVEQMIIRDTTDGYSKRK